ncbi:MAG TPA: zinc-binding alcohol dehydrogenase family protein [Haliscomenobacter sp.]|uniref:zinc-binding alcohol dehydrogenase family protein n=1 Tax=Haliscomenobacter sp. TaxID=2717303 RepID=UPI002C82C53D|nr:zinc-binding alcohol dehydrogenase family protein [Haliscomenobacter sp.]HOY17175.1 zinc-binding alcohol dehydrogenase family protein [Haliscomenobacter sp.]
MKAAVLYAPGGAENFQLLEVPIPSPVEGQVLIRVKAFGLNRSELMTRKGLSPNVQFPRVLGIECVGEVEFDPSEKYVKGQKVAAMMGGMGRDYDGSYAEYTVLPKTTLYPIQSSLPWDMLGAIPEMFQTVYGSLHLALNIQKGETLLIRGGTSSVGMLAIQMAKHQGLKVIASTRNPDKTQALHDNGATHVLIDDGQLKDKIHALFPRGVHKVLELVGAETLQDSLQCTRPGGITCMTGMLSEKWAIPNFAPMEFIPAAVLLTIFDSGQMRSATQSFQEFIQLVEHGEIKLNVNKVFSLDQIVAAHRYMESNQATGKIVVLT